MFFDEENGSQLSSAASQKQAIVAQLEDRVQTSFRQRFADAPDDDDADDIDVAAMGAGRQLFQCMRSEARKTKPEAVKALSLAVSQVPTVVGGHVGAGGYAHNANRVKVGSIVRRTKPKQSSETPTPEPSSAAPLCFKKESEITLEEATFGGPSAAVFREMGRVVVCNDESCDVELADGSRDVMAVKDVRMALPKEIEIFQRWIQYPQTRPQEVSSRKRDRNEEDLPSQSQASIPVSRWVQQRLFVRYIGSRYPEHEGKKFVVSDVGSRKEDRIVICGVEESSAVVLTVGQCELDTVLPRIGESGIVVGGPHTGQLATVLKRLKAPDGGVSGIVVSWQTSTDSAETSSLSQQVTLEPHLFCALRK